MAGIAEALVEFQKELPRIVKDSTAKIPTKGGGGYSYSYADLTAVTDKIIPRLANHGLAWSSQPTLHDGVFVLHYTLLHGESGESIEGDYPLPGGNLGPQDLGKAITYARRYALVAVTGVAPGGDDDDAQSVQQAVMQQPAKKPDGWKVRIAQAETVDALTEIFHEAQHGGWADTETMGQLSARRKALHA